MTPPGQRVFHLSCSAFVNIAKNADNNPNLNTDLAAIFDAIESSANGYPSEHDIKGLFADFDTTSNRLGNTVEEKTGVWRPSSKVWKALISVILKIMR